MSVRKGYNQNCPIAKGLDILGLEEPEV